MKWSHMRLGMIPGLGVILIGLILATSAHAASFWISPTVGYSWYDMSTVNREIQGHSYILPDAGTAGIESDLTFGGRLGWDFEAPFTFGFGFERLSASTTVSDETRSLEYDLPANAWSVFLQWAALDNKIWRVSLGLTVGALYTSGKLAADSSDSGNAYREADGSGLLVEGAVSAARRLHTRWAVYADAGYKYAKVDEIRESNLVVDGSDGEPLDIDYSGLAIRLGVRFYLSR